MNLVQINERLKDLPMQVVQQYANGMNPEVPPYLALGELQRRELSQKQMATAQGGMQGPQPSVKEQVEQKAGLMALQQMQQQQMAQQQAQPRGPMPAPAGVPQPQAQPEAAMMARGGLASIPVRSDMFEYAGGGIIAFKDEGLVSGGDDDDGGALTGGMSLSDLAYSRGDPALYSHALRRALTLGEQIGEFEPRTMSDEDYNKAIEKRYSLLQRLGGESPYAGFEQSLTDREARRAQAREEGKGLAALAAIPKVLQPGGTIRALGEGLGAFGGAMGKVAEADRAERSAIESLQFNIADAQRKERMGLGREAITAADQARRDVADLNRAHILKLQAQAQSAGRVAQAAKPTGRPPGKIGRAHV